MSHDLMTERLSGPIASVRVPFLPSGDIDATGLAGYIDRCVANGATALALTYGDSLYSLLTDDEVGVVTRLVVDAAGARVPVVAADRSWWTGRTVEFAGFCRDLGVDALMVLPPDWSRSATAETLVGHYGAVAAEIPVVMVSTYMVARGVANSLDIIEHVHESVQGVVAIKDDFGGDFGNRMTAAVSRSWAVIAGGSKSLHLQLWPFGASGYLSTLTPFRPEITRRYWEATTNSDAIEMARIIDEVDRPMFDVLRSAPGGFDAAIHGWCELDGIYGRWRRSPYHSLTDAELDTLGAQLDGLDLR